MDIKSICPNVIGSINWSSSFHVLWHIWKRSTAVQLFCQGFLQGAKYDIIKLSMRDEKWFQLQYLFQYHNAKEITLIHDLNYNNWNIMTFVFCQICIISEMILYWKCTSWHQNNGEWTPHLGRNEAEITWSKSSLPHLTKFPILWSEWGQNEAKMRQRPWDLSHLYLLICASFGLLISASLSCRHLGQRQKNCVK